MSTDVVAFYDAVAHDLRNPLNTLSMTLALLKRSDTGELTARAGRAMDRLQRMHDQLVGLSRLRGEGLVVRKHVLTLDEVCRRAITEVGATEIAIESPGNVTVAGDAELLVRAVSELVRNVVEHGGGQGVVRIGRDGTVVVESAAPVAEDLRPILFDPIARRVAKGKKATSGLGLGLYLARAYVEAHGGKLDATAVEGPTRFEVELPR